MNLKYYKYKIFIYFMNLRLSSEFRFCYSLLKEYNKCKHYLSCLGDNSIWKTECIIQQFVNISRLKVYLLEIELVTLAGVQSLLPV